MSYAIEWHPQTRDFLRKLNKEDAIRITKKIRSITDDPFRYLEHYESDKVYKLRVGDYRALIDVDFTSKILLVRILDHRSRIYK